MLTQQDREPHVLAALEELLEKDSLLLVSGFSKQVVVALRRLLASLMG
ncbi:MAG TPA: hypothetical protein VF427_07930 [Noviherbaspirillum sp.]